ncbi:MAG: GHKL domain-containing protein [Vallitaleaceae bacterium]|nr:GHKL domain-containing protein [Vallitaleaceae bacterium]
MSTDYFYVTLFFFILLYLIIFLFNFNKKQQEKLYVQHLESEMNTLSNYTKTVDNLYTDIQHYKHDIQNILLSVRHFIDGEDYESLKQFYYSKVLGQAPIQNATYQLLSNMHPIKHLSLKGLLFSKIEDMSNAGINLQLEILDSIEEIAMEDVDLCRVIGILLDNAIESAIESKDQNVILSCTNTNNVIEIAISNTFKELPDVKKMYQKNYSTKKVHQGIGLHSLTNILKNYPNACLKFRTNDLFFTHIVEISPVLISTP